MDVEATRPGTGHAVWATAWTFIDFIAFRYKLARLRRRPRLKTFDGEGKMRAPREVAKSPRQGTSITREGTAEFEFFRLSTIVPPRERRIFRVNKGEFFRRVFEEASHTVNGMTVTEGIDQEFNRLLDETPRDEPVTVNIYVYHCIASSGAIFRVSDYIISDVPLILPH